MKFKEQVKKIKQGLKNGVTINNLFILCIVFALTICGIFAIVSPTEINVYENRYANKMVSPTIETIGNNQFQDDVEAAISDQIPKASSFKGLYNRITSFFLVNIIQPLSESNPDEYIKCKNINFFDGILVHDYLLFDDIKKDLDVKINNINSIIEQNEELCFYVYFIERDADVNFETNEKLGAKEYVFSHLNLDEDRKASFDINSGEEYKKYFYATDHHWNYQGSYLAYKNILNFICENEIPIEPIREKKISDSYSGSKTGYLGRNTFKEEFVAYEFEYPALKIKSNGKVVDEYGNQEEFFAGERQDIAYGTFYGADDGEIIFSTGNSNKENVLIIGESFDNAILKLIASHFNNTHSIDLRYYEYFMGEKFCINEYAKEHHIDKVLLIGNVHYFTLEDFILG